MKYFDFITMMLLLTLSFATTINLNSPGEFEFFGAIFVMYSSVKLLNKFNLILFIFVIALCYLIYGIDTCYNPPIKRPTIEKLAFVDRECHKYLWWWAGWMRDESRYK